METCENVAFIPWSLCLVLAKGNQEYVQLGRFECRKSLRGDLIHRWLAAFHQTLDEGKLLFCGAEKLERVIARPPTYPRLEAQCRLRKSNNQIVQATNARGLLTNWYKYWIAWVHQNTFYWSPMVHWNCTSWWCSCVIQFYCVIKWSRQE